MIKVEIIEKYKRIANFLIVLFSACSISCRSSLVPGRYENQADFSFFEIYKDNTYHFSTIGDVHQKMMFSRGKIKLTKGEVLFIPDSSYFFHISVLKYYLDPSIGKDDRKIIVSSPDSIFNKFHFTFHDASSDSIKDFKNNKVIVYKPVMPRFDDGYIAIRATLKDPYQMEPGLLNKYLLSNRLYFSNVNNNDPNDPRWNVLEIKININLDMFAFTTVPPYIFKKKQLIKKEWPVYKLKE